MADINVVLLQTPSIKLQMFLQDKIKNKYNCKSESIIWVTNKSDLRKVKEIMNVSPPFGDKWYIEINLDAISDKTVWETIKGSSSCVFFLTCSKYVKFKDAKSNLEKVQGVYDFYINYLRRADFIYLYDAFVPSDNKLNKTLFDYVVSGYSGDIDTLFDLLLALNEGTKFESKRDIVKLCGIGGLSVDSYIFSFFKPLSGKEQGLKLVIKNRINEGVSLAENIGYKSMYNFMAKSLFALCELKMLTISGVIYKSVRNLPETYDEKLLARHQKYLWRLKEIPLSSLLELRQCMGNKPWNSNLDLLNFIYRYYDLKANKFLKGVV